MTDEICKYEVRSIKDFNDLKHVMICLEAHL